MKDHLEEQRQRLDQINSDLIPASDIDQARMQGASRDAPLDFVTRGITLARQNPILGTAFGLEALDTLSISNTNESQAAARIVLASGLCYWGYFFEALPYLKEARLCLSNRQQSDLRPYLTWLQVLSRRRVYRIRHPFETLVETSNQLEEQGQIFAAMQCRLDATSTADPTPEALNLLDQAQTYFSVSECAGEEAIALNIRAASEISQGAFDAAWEHLDYADRALTIARMPAMLSFTWYLKGYYLYHRRMISDAEVWLSKALRQSVALNHDYYAALSLSIFALMTYDAGKLAESLDYSYRVRTIAKSLRIKFLEAHSDLTSGHALVRQAKYRSAVANYHRARKIFAQLERDSLTAICDLNLGIVARRQGDWGSSLSLLSTAVDRSRSLGLYEPLALGLHNLAKTYAAFAYLDSAIEYERESIAVLREAGAHIQSIRPSIHLARLLVEKGLTKEAHNYLLSARRQAKASGLSFDEAICVQARGITFQAEGRNNQALYWLKRSLNQFESLDEKDAAWESRLRIAEICFTLGRRKQAQRTLSGLSRKTLPSALRWRWEVIAARDAYRYGQSRRAMELYLNALQRTRDARRTLRNEDQIAEFVLSLRGIYEESFGLAIERGEPHQALESAELYGSQLLSARLGYSVMPSNSRESQIARIQHLMNAQLGSDWSIVRYAWHQHDIWLFHITPDGMTSRRLDFHQGVNIALNSARFSDITMRQLVYLGQAQGQRNAKEQGETVRQRLFQALLPNPILKNVESRDHTLIVIPSGELYGLAFHALLDGDIPLVEKTKVVYAQSLDLLCASLEHNGNDSASQERGLICALSEFGEAFESLPHVHDEVTSIQNHLPIADVVIEAQFTRDRFANLNKAGKLADYKWMHFATHTQIDSATGAITGLVSADQMIAIQDILKWRLNADVVTLSACQTGSGKYYYGDEIAGLTQSFLSAGAHSVVASMWLADDERTGNLMASFYGSLSRGNRPSAALAEAQREAHRAGVPAYYWAPFTVFGRP